MVRTSPTSRSVGPSAQGLNATGRRSPRKVDAASPASNTRLLTMRGVAALSALQRLGRAAISMLFAFHVLAVLAINLPLNSPFGNELRSPFEPYYYVSGIWQNWAMFDTIPRYRSIHPRLLAQWSAEQGKTQTFGAAVPGLERYRHSTRLVSLYLRYVWQSGDYAVHVRTYLLRACAEIERRAGAKPARVSLVLDSQILIPLAQVRSSGRVAVKHRDTSPISVVCP